jgi:hypothetical protein
VGRLEASSGEGPTFINSRRPKCGTMARTQNKRQPHLNSDLAAYHAFRDWDKMDRAMLIKLVTFQFLRYIADDPILARELFSYLQYK